VSAAVPSNTPAAAQTPAPGQTPAPKPEGQIEDTVSIGRPRFAVSVGLAYAPLRRQTYGKVSGLARDAQGVATGTALASVLGFSENSPRRLTPLVLLNTRLTNFHSNNLYFSFGLSGKRGADPGLEYLIGPSLSLLNERVFLTFGGYAGLQQQLNDDLFLSAGPLTDAGDNLSRQKYRWKPGFAVSFNPFSTTRATGRSVTQELGAPAKAVNRKDEIRLGNIPFSLALGLSYTNLARREYGSIVGLERNQQGVVTGTAFTNIIGLTKQSSYRLRPLAMLHTRLTDFPNHDLYFSIGVTAKRTGDAKKDLSLEYLLGPSTNLLDRKVFLTFGAFVGLEQRLVSDAFIGQKTPGQAFTQNEFHWRPGFAISYSFSSFLKTKPEQK
jgi:hypothetical protein